MTDDGPPGSGEDDGTETADEGGSASAPTGTAGGGESPTFRAATGDDGQSTGDASTSSSLDGSPQQEGALPGGSRRAMVGAAVGTGLIFVLVQVLSLALVEPFVTAGYQTVEDPSDPTNSLLYLGVILVATAGILLVVRLGVEGILRAVITLVSGLLAWYVFSVVVPVVVPGAAGDWIALGAAAALALALYVYPEWYVIDLAGVIIGAGGAALFGISFGPLPAIVLLLVLAVYDAVSVYRTKHMLDLAESVTDLKLPLVLVVPLSLSYSFLDDSPVDATDREGPREAFFIGLGDTVIPTVLVASAAFFTEAPAFDVPGVSLTLPAAGAMLGTLLGLTGLLVLVSRGRAHAGLPLLNGGAISGYLVGAVLAGIPLVQAAGLTPYL